MNRDGAGPGSPPSGDAEEVAEQRSAPTSGPVSAPDSGPDSGPAPAPAFGPASAPAFGPAPAPAFGPAEFAAGLGARRGLVTAEFALGLGARRGLPLADLDAAVTTALAEAGIPPARVGVLATLDRRAAEPNVRALCRARGWPLVAFTAAELAAQPVSRPGAAVEAAVGTPSVAEAAALLAAGPGAVLRLPKRAFRAVTVAAAGKRPPGPAQ